jgi:hypothetical protein
VLSALGIACHTWLNWTGVLSGYQLWSSSVVIESKFTSFSLISDVGQVAKSFFVCPEKIILGSVDFSDLSFRPVSK